jgi:Protein of unknown function (DUF3298)
MLSALMNSMKKATLAYLPILLIFALTAFGQRKADAQSTKLASSFRCTFLGSIDNRFKIQMWLDRDGDRVLGSYFYEKTREETGEVNDLELEGQIRQDGTFVILESDRHTPTGTFKGKLRSEMVNGESILKMIGTWSKPGDKKELAFSATELHIDLGSGLKLKSIEKTEYDAPSKSRTSAAYPQLEGDGRAAGFNQAVNAIVKSEVGELSGDVKDPLANRGQETSSFELSYDVTAGNPSLISVSFGLLSDVEGAAHSNFHSIVLNYDLRARKVLALADLFKSDADYLKLLSDYCIRNLTKREVSDAEWLQRGAGPEAENYKNWNLLPSGLLITFDEYQVAPRAQGTQEVFIPYAKLKEIINPTGPLQSLLK